MPPQVVHVIKALLAERAWLPTQVAAIVQIELQRDKKVPESTKMYVGRGSGVFQSIKLLVQTFEGRPAPSIRFSCDWDAQVARADLAELIPANATRKLNPPALGSKGPLRVSTTVSVQHPDALMHFGFESLEKGPDYLRALALERPRAVLAPEDFVTECFRAYAVNVEHQPYAIERRSTQRDAVVVSTLGLSGRKLQLSFETVEAPIAEPLARKLIEQLLLGQLLQGELAGKYDSVDYLATELGSSTHVPNPGFR